MTMKNKRSGEGGSAFDLNGLPDKARCYGCGSCAQACPAQCLIMTEDGEGFLYPRADGAGCLRCGRCRQVCARLKPKANGKRREAWAAIAKDAALQARSSSGGVFGVLARDILARGGVVFGAAFDEDFSVRHIAVKQLEQLHLIMGSKYAQSRIEDSYRQTRTALKSGLAVLFSGTACQIAGLKAFLGTDYPQLYTVGVLCFGAPSPLVWKRYLRLCEENKGSAAAEISFIDKSLGWTRRSVRVRFQDGTSSVQPGSKNEYMRVFFSGLCLRPACWNCEFRGVDRPSDITLGDFWGAERRVPHMYDENGTSAVIVHTEKGAELFAEARNSLRAERARLWDIRIGQEAAFSRALPVSGREGFFSALNGASLEELDLMAKRSEEYTPRRIARLSQRVWRKLRSIPPMLLK